jgi:hypothetical protein
MAVFLEVSIRAQSTMSLKILPKGEGALQMLQHLGTLPIGAIAIRPDLAPNWQSRAELSLLFPER